jgi:hypothetical protein
MWQLIWEHLELDTVNSMHPLAPKLDVQSNAKKSECPLSLLVHNMQSNEQPIKSWIFCRVQWDLILIPKG